MNFISYPIFLIIQLLAGITLIIAPIVTGAGSSVVATLAAIGLIEIVVALLSKEKKYLNFALLLDLRITSMVFFIAALVLTFSPYLLAFVGNNPLVITTTAVSAVTLLSFVFANLTLPDQDITE